MKRFLLFLGIFLILLGLLFPSAENKTLSLKEVPIEDEKRAMFLSYLEYESLLKGKDQKGLEEELTHMIDTLAENHFNMLIVQVRSFSDAIYPSEIFPSSETLVSHEGDPLLMDILSFLITKAHEKGMEVHAWINPYRIRSTDDGSTLSYKNPAYKWLGSNQVKIIKGKGIFYNPASSEVRALVLEGIEEILKKYAVDGILFDDYFYPDDTIDQENYQAYLKEEGTLSLDEYRLEQVNELVKSTYALVHAYNKVFSISPEGNMDNNYEINYADTKRWMQEEGYIDYIIPQIYFGFYNEKKPFYETVRKWNSYITIDTVQLIPALAFYKVGKVDQYALAGKEEWEEYQNIIGRQIIASRPVSHYKGFALFRYEYLFGSKYETEAVINERESLLHLLKWE